MDAALCYAYSLIRATYRALGLAIPDMFQTCYTEDEKFQMMVDDINNLSTSQAQAASVESDVAVEESIDTRFLGSFNDEQVMAYFTVDTTQNVITSVFYRNTTSQAAYLDVTRNNNTNHFDLKANIPQDFTYTIPANRQPSLDGVSFSMGWPA